MPASGAVYIEKGEKGAKEINQEKVVSIIGSCWSMDRKTVPGLKKHTVCSSTGIQSPWRKGVESWK